jgi:hypothetical protein
MAYVTLDADGLLKEVNLTTAFLLGIGRGRLIDRPLGVLVARADRRKFLEHIRRCRAGERPVRTELCLHGAARERIPVEVVSRPEAERPGSFRTVLFDLRGRLAQEEQERRAEEERRLLRERETAAHSANEAKDRFLALLSHELRAPLTPILATVEALEADTSLEEPLREALAVIRRNARSQAGLVDDLLDLTRLGHGKLRLSRELVDLHKLVEEAVADASELIRGKQMVVHLQLEAGCSWVNGDPLRLRQVISNLLGNALKFTEVGGEVTVRTDQPRPARVRLELMDNGRGLTRCELERIFDPFEQARQRESNEQGLGVGLSIAKGIVELHGGQIRADSAGPGRGARFAVELETVTTRPLAAAPGARVLRARRAAAICQVLLVEDHLDSAEALRVLLERYGYRVKVATSVADALKQGTADCELLISDIGLSDGTGYALLRQLPPGLPAIAVSGFGSPEDVRRSREAGFADHLVKPVPVDDLLAAIERALHREDHSSLCSSPPAPQ